ncbi:MAG: hypothetical protein IJN82_01325, partial [Clostridia bacterium]|nr:hypothetical protein [Clostridia bacterium]
LNCEGDAMLQAPLQATLKGDRDKPEEAIALFCQGNLTVESEVSVEATDAACGIKGKTVTIRKEAAVTVSNENQLETEALAEAGIYSINAIAGTEGITLAGKPAVEASVKAVGLAECVMAGQTYESSSSVGDLLLEGGSLKATATCSETAAFGVGGIRVVLNGGRLEAKAFGTERADRISAAVVAGRYGGVSVGEGMQIASPKGGYISSDGRTVVTGAGETASEVTVSAGNGGVFRDTVSSSLEWICLGVCLVLLAGIGVAVYLRCKKERNAK